MLYKVFTCAYLLWSVIQTFSGIGNPYKDGGTQTGYVIYEPLTWRNRTVPTLSLLLMIVFVVNPVIFLLLRTVSRLAPGRLCKEFETDIF